MTLRIALAQVNPKVGDLTGNAALIRRVRDSAAERQSDLVVEPEQALGGTAVSEVDVAQVDHRWSSLLEIAWCTRPGLVG